MKESILEIAAKYSTEFLVKNGKHFDDLVNGLLGEIGKAVKADRAYLFTLHGLEDGVPYARHRFEWCADGIKPQIDNAILRTIPLLPKYEELFEKLCNGEHWCLYDATGDEVLKEQDILSMCLIPIRMPHNLWGFIGFDQCTHYREWGKSEKNALQISANIIGAARAKNARMTQLEETTEILSRLESGIRGSQGKAVRDIDDMRRILSTMQGGHDGGV